MTSCSINVQNIANELSREYDESRVLTRAIGEHFQKLRISAAIKLTQEPSPIQDALEAMIESQKDTNSKLRELEQKLFGLCETT